MKNRYLEAEKLVQNKKNRALRRRTLSNPWNKTTRCLQHASVLLLCLTIVMHSVRFLVSHYVPELLLDERDALTDSDAAFFEYAEQIKTIETVSQDASDTVSSEFAEQTGLLEEEIQNEDLNSIEEEHLLSAVPLDALPHHRDRMASDNWFGKITAFLRTVFGIQQNQETIDTKRTKFPFDQQ